MVSEDEDNLMDDILADAKPKNKKYKMFKHRTKTFACHQCYSTYNSEIELNCHAENCEMEYIAEVALQESIYKDSLNQIHTNKNDYLSSFGICKNVEIKNHALTSTAPLCLKNLVKEPRILSNTYISSLLYYWNFVEYVKIYNQLSHLFNSPINQMYKSKSNEVPNFDDKIIKKIVSLMLYQPLTNLKYPKYEKYCEKYYLNIIDKSNLFLPNNNIKTLDNNIEMSIYKSKNKNKFLVNFLIKFLNDFFAKKDAKLNLKRKQISSVTSRNLYEYKFNYFKDDFKNANKIDSSNKYPNILFNHLYNKFTPILKVENMSPNFIKLSESDKKLLHNKCLILDKKLLLADILYKHALDTVLPTVLLSFKLPNIKLYQSYNLKNDIIRKPCICCFYQDKIHGWCNKHLNLYSKCCKLLLATSNSKNKNYTIKIMANKKLYKKKQQLPIKQIEDRKEKIEIVQSTNSKVFLSPILKNSLHQQASANIFEYKPQAIKPTDSFDDVIIISDDEQPTLESFIVSSQPAQNYYPFCSNIVASSTPNPITININTPAMSSPHHTHPTIIITPIAINMSPHPTAISFTQQKTTPTTLPPPVISNILHYSNRPNFVTTSCKTCAHGPQKLITKRPGQNVDTSIIDLTLDDDDDDYRDSKVGENVVRHKFSFPQLPLRVEKRPEILKHTDNSINVIDLISNLANTLKSKSSMSLHPRDKQKHLALETSKRTMQTTKVSDCSALHHSSDYASDEEVMLSSQSVTNTTKSLSNPQSHHRPHKKLKLNIGPSVHLNNNPVEKDQLSYGVGQNLKRALGLIPSLNLPAVKRNNRTGTQSSLNQLTPENHFPRNDHESIHVTKKEEKFIPNLGDKALVHSPVSATKVIKNSESPPQSEGAISHQSRQRASPNALLKCHLCLHIEHFENPDMINERIAHHLSTIHKDMGVDVECTERRDEITGADTLLVECYPSRITP